MLWNCFEILPVRIKTGKLNRKKTNKTNQTTNNPLFFHNCFSGTAIKIRYPQGEYYPFCHDALSSLVLQQYNSQPGDTDLTVGINKRWLWQQTTEVVVAREGTQQCQYHMQLLSLDSPSVLLLPQMVRLKRRTRHLLQGKNVPPKQLWLIPCPWQHQEQQALSTLSQSLEMAQKEKLIYSCFKIILSSFHPWTPFVINFSEDLMRRCSDYKCIFKTSLLSIIPQWLDKKLPIYHLLLIPFWVKMMSK